MSMRLYYEPDERIITDEFGDEVPNIYDYITPNDLFLWMHKKDDMIIQGVSKENVELIYLQDEYHLYWKEYLNDSNNKGE